MVPEKSLGTGIGQIWYRKKVSKPVSEKFGTGKKSRNRYRSNLVPIKSLGTGIVKIWYRKKVSEPVSEKFYTGTEFRRQNLGILKIYNGYRYRYQDFLFFWWYRSRYRKSLVPEKVSLPVSEKFDTGTEFRRQNLGILKIYNGYRCRIGTGTENFSFFWWYRNRYRKNLVPEKSLGTGIGQIWYREKVSEPVSEIFGTEKSYRYRYRKYLVLEKSIGIGIVQHFEYRHTLLYTAIAHYVAATCAGIHLVS